MGVGLGGGGQGGCEWRSEAFVKIQKKNFFFGGGGGGVGSGGRIWGGVRVDGNGVEAFVKIPKQKYFFFWGGGGGGEGEGRNFCENSKKKGGGVGVGWGSRGGRGGVVRSGVGVGEVG